MAFSFLAAKASIESPFIGLVVNTWLERKIEFIQCLVIGKCDSFRWVFLTVVFSCLSFRLQEAAQKGGFFQIRIQPLSRRCKAKIFEKFPDAL